MISDPNPDPTGPSFDNLSKLHKLLPSIAKDMATGKMKGKGKPVLRTKPRQICKVCAVTFDLVAQPEESEMKPGICEKCEGMLKGNIALVCADKYAFVSSSKLPDLVGQIVHMKPENFRQIESAFELVAKQREKPNDGQA